MEVLPDLNRSTEDLGAKSREVGNDTHLQSMTVGRRRIKPGLGRTTTATWEVPATARSFLVGFRDRCVMSN